ncbi:hypothetical protein [Rugosimonospora africana]|uniref:Uncharacterized protein n=1 Tax=Rugosimonospora africana TaxID=556532 RepID=A0A8J3R0K1_9ACTN|nr:hypothetical protein [Rugosimonospora africana]GIH19160.1 hypothetical protein Raf01_73320 [Rugosimonospora africana]
MWITADALIPARPRLSAVLAVWSTTTLPAPAAPIGRPRPMPRWLSRLLDPGLMP